MATRADILAKMPATDHHDADAQPSTAVTLADLDACLDALAQLIDMGEAQYMPLFERIETELAALRETETVEDRVAIRLGRLGNPAKPDQTAARSSRAA